MADVIVLDGPPDVLLEKLAAQHPEWTVDDWAEWWGHWQERAINRRLPGRSIEVCHG